MFDKVNRLTENFYFTFFVPFCRQINKSLHKAQLILCLFLGSAFLTGCNQIEPEVAPASVPPPGFGANDLKARGPGSNSAFGAFPTGRGPSGGVVAGMSPSANLAGSPNSPILSYADEGTPPGGANSGNGFQLNFENADVSAVAKTILGDILGENFIVDPRVSGQISLTSSHPVPKAQLVPLFESALLAINAVIVKQDGTYRIAPAADSGGLHGVDYHAVGEGFGTSVIVAKNVPAAMIAHLLESYGSRAGTIKVEAAPNFVIVQGTAAERQAALDAASLVDVDWLRSKSVALLPLANSSPETVIGEVNRILGTGEGGVSQDIVQMQPVNRLNAVLAVSRNRAAIDKVTRWVAKLDQADYGALGVKVYKLQYADAKSVAGILNEAFGGSGKTSSGQDDKDLLQPGGSSSTGTGAGTGTAGGFGSGTGTAGGLGGASGSQSPFGASSNGTGFGTNTGTGGQGTGQNNPFGSLRAGGTSSPNDTSASGGGGGGAGKSVIRITANIANNELLIFANRLDYKLIERTIRELDRAPLQIDVEVTIAEVDLNNTLQYGVQAYLNSGVLGLEYTNAAAGSATTSSVAGTPLQTTNPGLNLIIGNTANPRLVINALAQVTQTKVLSNPSLVVADGKPAVFQVGDQVPIQTGSVTSTVGGAVTNSFSYLDTGIILNVLPRVNANGVVSLEVDQQISSVTTPASTTSSSTTNPTIQQRRVKSYVSVTDGQTVLLAGLITDNRNTGRTGIPGLDQLVFLRDLLSTTSNTIGRSELIIFIKPQIIKNGFDAQQVSEEFRERLQTMQARRGVYKPSQ